MNYKNINKKQLKEILDKKEDIVLIDVRTKDEFLEGSIESAINLPLQDIPYNIDELDEYRDSKIVIYCRSGHRSITACNLLSVEGFDNLYNLDKGIIHYF